MKYYVMYNDGYDYEVYGEPCDTVEDISVELYSVIRRLTKSELKKSMIHIAKCEDDGTPFSDHDILDLWVGSKEGGNLIESVLYYNDATALIRKYEQEDYDNDIDEEDFYDIYVKDENGKIYSVLR